MDKCLVIYRTWFARKSANIILYNVFSRNEGIAVDTHVWRIVQKISLTDSNNPLRIERDLMQVVLLRDWGRFNYLMVEHRWSVSQDCPSV